MARSSATGGGAGGLAGPLAGVMAGLLAAGDAQWLVVAPCDTPFLPPDLAARLVGAALATACRWPMPARTGAPSGLHGAAGVVAARIA